MTARIRAAKPTPRVPSLGSARSRRGSSGPTVSGAIPVDLEGSLLQAAIHPRWSAGAECVSTPQSPLLDSGVRLSGGRAQWYRQGAGPQPAAASPAAGISRVAQVSSGGQGPDEAGPAAVARPTPDPLTGEWHTVATYPGLGHAEHLRLGPDGQVRHTEPFGLDGAPLIHAVAATERHVVVFDLPVTYRRAAALLGARFPYAWQAGRPARLGLLTRGVEQPRWFPIKPGYVFNAINAWDDGDRVVVDAVRHERAFDPTTCSVRGPLLWRWVLDLSTGTVDEGPLARVPVEWPSVDPRVRGRAHRVVFGARVAVPFGAPGEAPATALVRHDLVTGQTQQRVLPAGHSAGQPVFVPRPDRGAGGRPAEGDGWLLSVVHDLAGGRSDLVVLDAEDLRVPALASVHLPVRLPDCLHTYWQPA